MQVQQEIAAALAQRSSIADQLATAGLAVHNLQQLLNLTADGAASKPPATSFKAQARNESRSVTRKPGAYISTTHVPEKGARTRSHHDTVTSQLSKIGRLEGHSTNVFQQPLRSRLPSACPAHQHLQTMVHKPDKYDAETPPPTSWGGGSTASDGTAPLQVVSEDGSLHQNAADVHDIYSTAMHRHGSMATELAITPNASRQAEISKPTSVVSTTQRSTTPDHMCSPMLSVLRPVAAETEQARTENVLPTQAAGVLRDTPHIRTDPITDGSRRASIHETSVYDKQQPTVLNATPNTAGYKPVNADERAVHVKQPPTVPNPASNTAGCRPVNLDESVAHDKQLTAKLNATERPT